MSIKNELWFKELIFNHYSRNYNFKKRSFIGLFLFLVLNDPMMYSMALHPRIVSVEFTGNKKTLDYIIEREIQHKIDVPLDSVVANEDRNRLENLGLFSEVIWNIIPMDAERAILSFVLSESIQRTPPGAFPIYEEDTGWSFMGAWILQNFRGRNQILHLNGSIGGKDTYGVSFLDPWMFGNHVSLSLNLSRLIYNHNFLDMQIDVNSFEIGLGKWFGDFIKTSTSIEIEKKSFSDKQILDTFFYIAPRFSIKYDTRDIYWNPSKGVLLSQFIYYRKGIDPKNYTMTIWRQSYSIYYKINSTKKKLVLAFNIKSKFKYGVKDEYGLNYFGDSFTVRGWSLPDNNLFSSGKETFRFGHESAQATVELRKDIIPKYATKLGTEFGLGIVAFYDIGTINHNWDRIIKMSPMSGAGIGIRIPAPMLDVIRLDYGWGYKDGEWNSGALHLGFEQKF